MKAEMVGVVLQRRRCLRLGWSLPAVSAPAIGCEMRGVEEIALRGSNTTIDGGSQEVLLLLCSSSLVLLADLAVRTRTALAYRISRVLLRHIQQDAVTFRLEVSQKCTSAAAHLVAGRSPIKVHASKFRGLQCSRGSGGNCMDHSLSVRLDDKCALTVHGSRL
ncbi:hypothetical protein BJ546DRAFT_24810 [Cryomyces antarcticus]